jgi:RNA polymerase sigma-70 factor (ECF subfamily)
MREELCIEAIRLARWLAGLMPHEPEVLGLLALMLLIDSRRDARVTADGELIALADQDRSRWDRALIAEGRSLVRHCLERNRPGPYQIQAAINAVHSGAPTATTTDWRRILALYDQLLSFAPNAIVMMNRAVAVAEVQGPEAALAVLDTLDLPRYYLFHAVRADLLARVGRVRAAMSAYDEALAWTANESERKFMMRRRQQLRDPSG